MSLSAIQWPIAESPSNVQYSDAQQAQYINQLFGGNSHPDAGVFRGVLSELKVTASSPAAQSIDVQPGIALINGRLIYIETAQTLILDANASGNSRIDLIVATFVDDDYPTPAQLSVVKGTPSGSPAAPGLTQTVLTEWQIPLAEVLLVNGYSSVLDADISDRRVWKNVVDRLELAATNGSGAGLAVGAVTTWKAGSDQTFETSTSDEALFAGIVSAYIANSGVGKLVTTGPAYIYVDSAVTRYDEIYLSESNAGQGAIGGDGAAIGRALESTSGAGLCLCYIYAVPRLKPNRASALVGAATASTSYVIVTGGSATITKRHSNSRIRCTFNAYGVHSATAGQCYFRFYDAVGATLFGREIVDYAPGANYRMPWALIQDLSGYEQGDTVTVEIHYHTAAGTVNVFAGEIIIEEVVD